MTFFERYATIAEKQGLDPCSQKAADLFGVTKATISTWGLKGTTPKGETVAKMADELHISTDYLLGRTDDPTDFVNDRFMIMPAPIPADPPPETTIQLTEVETGQKEDEAGNALIRLINRLDMYDQLRAEGVIQGMLMQEKYTHRKA